MRPQVVVAALAMSCSIGCESNRRYELSGQVLVVDPARQELTIKHGDIRGFMPGMTMPFKVQDANAMASTTVGDLVDATLIVGRDYAYLASVRRTGHAPLSEAPPAPRVALVEPGALVPDAPLVDEQGRAHRLSDWKGLRLAVTFIYTRCPLPDFCPRMNRNFVEVQRAVAANPSLAGRVRLLSISFDPEYDTPAVLADYAKRVGADPKVWSFLTGDRDTVAAFAAAFGVSTSREGADVLHNLRTAAIDGDRRIVQIFTGNTWTSAELVAALEGAR